MDVVYRMISKEGIINDNEELASNLNEFIRSQPPDAFRQEDQEARHNRARCTAGRLEHKVRQRLATIMGYSCRGGAAIRANEIMIRLGYQAYALQSCRWRRFIENMKRKVITRNVIRK